uniref:Uncharacterized protein n=1 Tax=Anguilla anguilla TaxID=7936 RepID=A0A0E9UHN2_ANGAN
MINVIRTRILVKLSTKIRNGCYFCFLELMCRENVKLCVCCNGKAAIEGMNNKVKPSTYAFR